MGQTREGLEISIPGRWTEGANISRWVFVASAARFSSLHRARRSCPEQTSVPLLEVETLTSRQEENLMGDTRLVPPQQSEQG